MQSSQLALSLYSWTSLSVPEFQRSVCEACSKNTAYMTCESCGTIFFNIVGSSNGESLNHPLSNIYGEPEDLKCAAQSCFPKILPIIVDGKSYQTVDQYYGSVLLTLVGRKDQAAIIEKGFGMNLAWYIDNAVSSTSIETISLEQKINYMKRGLFAKFTQNQELQDFLLSTGEVYLIFRGRTVNGLFSDINYKNERGQNLLGHLLMELRWALRNGFFAEVYTKQRMRLREDD